VNYTIVLKARQGALEASCEVQDKVQGKMQDNV